MNPLKSNIRPSMVRFVALNSFKGKIGQQPMIILQGRQSECPKNQISALSNDVAGRFLRESDRIDLANATKICGMYGVIGER
jgi:hypothetical protein